MNIDFTTNSIFLRHKRKIFLPVGKNITYGSPIGIREIATLLKNIEHYGFTFSDELLQEIVKLPAFEISNVYSNLIGALKRSIGAHVKHKPMYPNFPQQVMDMDEAELYLNAMMHYFGDWFGIRIMPNYVKKDRPELTEKTVLKVIGLGTQEEFEKIFTDLVSSKVSLSPADKEDLFWFIEKYNNPITQLLPKDIPNKENKVCVVKSLLTHRNGSEKDLQKYFNTATDILRFAVALSDGDISLASKTKFKNFTHQEKKMLKHFAENCKNLKEDMMRYKEFWKRLNEKIHINEKTPKLHSAILSMIDDEKITTFNSRVEQELSRKNIEAIIPLLKKRPGEFARRLDHLLRISNTPFGMNQDDVINAFSTIAEKVPTQTLFTIMNHFKNRKNSSDLRVFFPKGDIGKLKAIENNLPNIYPDVTEKIVSVCKNALISQYGKLEPLGKVYLSEKLKNYTIPFGLRSASKTLKTIGRGSRIPLENKNILRFFLYWKQPKDDRTDIDLSSVCFDENFEYKGHVNYWNMRSNNGFHSGDITSAPKGASEFIDIDIGKQLSSGIRYIAMSINSFSLQNFSELPECFAGFMEREELGKGEIYEPKTVKEKFDIASQSRISIPLIFDLIERKAIWVDLALKHSPNESNHIAGSLSSLSVLIKSMVELKKPSLYDLFSLHVQARGTLVANIEDADMVFSTESGITHLDSEEILANYL